MNATETESVPFCLFIDFCLFIYLHGTFPISEDLPKSWKKLRCLQRQRGGQDNFWDEWKDWEHLNSVFKVMNGQGNSASDQDIGNQVDGKSGRNKDEPEKQGRLARHLETHVRRWTQCDQKEDWTTRMWHLSLPPLLGKKEVWSWSNAMVQPRTSDMLPAMSWTDPKAC